MYSRTRGYLPHVIQPDSIYFVTFRLVDSLPAKALNQCKERAHIKVITHSTNKLNYEYQEAIQEYLDTSYGNCLLKKPEIASIVNTAIRYFNNDRYELLAWTIMPNHVHVLLKLLGNHVLSAILHSWKSFSSNEANRMLARTGEFWQREYFDVLVRSERQLEFFLRYVLNNPVKAGLCKEIFQWPWTGCSEEMQAVARKFFL
jgi:REP element-mobilizing transposase RayT